jgi:hypothetical protein
MLPTARTNSSSMSIRKPHLQNMLSDTNAHEKPQTPTLSVEALRNIADIVRALKARINGANSHDRDNTAKCATLDSGSTATTCPMGSEDTDSTKKENR